MYVAIHFTSYLVEWFEFKTALIQGVSRKCIHTELSSLLCHNSHTYSIGCAQKQLLVPVINEVELNA